MLNIKTRSAQTVVLCNCPSRKISLRVSVRLRSGTSPVSMLLSGEGKLYLMETGIHRLSNVKNEETGVRLAREECLSFKLRI